MTDNDPQILINRDGNQFGPYSLAEAKRHYLSGNIVATDTAKVEGGEWSPVLDVLGIAPPPPKPTIPPPPKPHSPMLADTSTPPEAVDSSAGSGTSTRPIATKPMVNKPTPGSFLGLSPTQWIIGTLIFASLGALRECTEDKNLPVKLGDFDSLWDKDGRVKTGRFIGGY